MAKVSKAIKINDLLYEIVSSSFNNQCGEFCPVLLKIKDHQTCIEINKKLRKNWTHECIIDKKKFLARPLGSSVMNSDKEDEDGKENPTYGKCI